MFWLVFMLIHRVAARPAALAIFSSWSGAGPTGVLVVVLATLALWKKGRVLYRTLTSVPFAVAMLTFIMVATALGTVILQGGHAGHFVGYYGPTLSSVLVNLGFNDIFHSVWFSGFLVLLAISLILVAVKGRWWRVRHWGHLLSHLGIALILIGGSVGHFWGFKGAMDLYKGRPADAAVTLEWGMPVGERRALGFSIRLDEFEVERYAPEYRLYVYERDGSSYRAARSLAVEDAEAWVSIGGDGVEFRLVQCYPDFYVREELREAAPGKGVPGVELDVREGDTSERVHLLAGVPGRDTLDLGPDGPLIHFVWESVGEEEIASLLPSTPEAHRIRYWGADLSASGEVVVEPGGAYSLLDGQYQLRVMEYVPDFLLDIETGQVSTRTQEPNNPAIKVATARASEGPEETRWLFSRTPPRDHQQRGNHPTGPALIYAYEPAQYPPEKAFVIVGNSRQVWEFERGKLVDRASVDGAAGEVPGTPSMSFRIFDSAELVRTPASRSDTWRNPVAEVQVRGGSEPPSAVLISPKGKPLFLDDGEIALAFERKGDDIKAFRSRVTVLDGDAEPLETTVAVNDPLSYRGYSFYQFNFRSDDPTYSGFLVVKDPGMPLVWSGFVMICFGVAFSYYVRPRIGLRGTP